MRSAGIIRALLAGLFLASLSGCGGHAIKVSKVTGRVTLDGAPLPDAVVTFNPVAKEGHVAMATTDSSGNFSLQTFEPGDGATPGEYKATVVAVKATSERAVNVSGGGAFDQSAKQKPPESLVHANYTDIKKTPFTVTVPTGSVELKLKADGT